MMMTKHMLGFLLLFTIAGSSIAVPEDGTIRGAKQHDRTQESRRLSFLSFWASINAAAEKKWNNYWGKINRAANKAVEEAAEAELAAEEAAEREKNREKWSPLTVEDLVGMYAGGTDYTEADITAAIAIVDSF